MSEHFIDHPMFAFFTHRENKEHLCSECGEDTKRLREEAVFIDDTGPLCFECQQRIEQQKGGRDE